MAYEGWLVKIGDYKIPEDKFIKADSYSAYVNMQDIDDWTDADGCLHRFPADLKALKVEFETPAMLTEAMLEELLVNIRRNYVDEAGREVVVEAYAPEYNDYIMQRCYMADIKPAIYRIFDNVIKYNPIRFSFIGGLADE